MTSLRILRAGPLATLQDEGRFGMLAVGISASGPMDRAAFRAAGARLGQVGATGIEFSQALRLSVDGPVRVALAGGAFQVQRNGVAAPWDDVLALAAGDELVMSPGTAGNFGYVRFERELAVAPVLGSTSTNVTVGLGGWKGRALRDGDVIGFGAMGAVAVPVAGPVSQPSDGAIRVLWGLHADLFDADLRQRFVASDFTISSSLDRMGVRLGDGAGVFAAQRRLTLVSDPIVPGDLQILGDGTPIVLMRDHQPTGGYPRLATIVTADFDRFAQMRPGQTVRFRPVTQEHVR